MHKTVHSSVAHPGVVVTLDDCLVEVPSPIAGSLTDVCDLLERLALQSSRVLTSVVVDGANRETSGSFPETKPFSRVEAKTVSLHKFACAATERIESRLAAMSATVEQVVVLVLINNREFARAAWRQWICELRAIQVEFNFLGELAESPPARGSVDGPALARHWEAFHIIDALVEVLLVDDLTSWDGGPAAAFSTVCERHFLVWLNRLRWFFEQAVKSYGNHVAAE